MIITQQAENSGLFSASTKNGSRQPTEWHSGKNVLAHRPSKAIQEKRNPRNSQVSVIRLLIFLEPPSQFDLAIGECCSVDILRIAGQTGFPDATLPHTDPGVEVTHPAISILEMGMIDAAHLSHPGNPQGHNARRPTKPPGACSTSISGRCGRRRKGVLPTPKRRSPGNRRQRSQLNFRSAHQPAFSFNSLSFHEVYFPF